MVLVGWTAVFAAGSRDAQPTQHRVSEAVGDVTAPLLAAIDRGDVAPEGRDARYLITWTDGTYIGSPGYALVTELEQLESGRFELVVRPLDSRVSYRTASVREVLEVWRKRRA